MRWILSLLPPMIAAPAAAQVVPPAPPSGPVVYAPGTAPAPAWRNPAADYITVGQDELGYRSWYSASPRHAFAVKNFNDYLAQYEVSGVLPTWQILRTATSWHRCGGAPFEVPPTSEWPHIVQTLRYIRDYVVPASGPVEAVSAYRNPALNACAGGAPESAHKHYSAIDMVPLQPISRPDLMRKLCAAQARRGSDYQVGLGFYAFLRFHVDTTKYRRWNMDPSVAALCPPIVRRDDVATTAQPVVTQAPADPAATIGAKTVYAPAASDPPPLTTTLPITSTVPEPVATLPQR